MALDPEQKSRARAGSAERAARWRERNPERAKEVQRECAKRTWADPVKRERMKAQRRLRKYGVSDQEHALLIAKQRGRCAICGEQPGTALHVDHCHESLAIRGLLCNSCNNGLGRFRDNPTLLRRAADYLEAV